MSGPLDGVRVLELCHAWAGPFVGRLLASLGADVVKVESATRFDGWRAPAAPKLVLADVPGHIDPDAVSIEVAPNYNSLSRNKRGIAVDLSTDAGRDVALRLAARSDVVTANFTARVLSKLRLDDADLRAVNRGVILLTMPALGNTGPYRDAVGYGTVVEGMGGFGSRFGYTHEGARISDTYYPDPVAGLHAAVAVLAALEKRRRTGEGSFVDLSHQEALWLQFGETLVFAARHRRDPAREGNAQPGSAVSGVFRTQDERWLAVATRSDAEAAALAAECEDVAAWVASRALDDAVARLAEIGVGTSVVHAYLSAAADPSNAALFERVTHPVSGEQTYLRVPVRVDGEPRTTSRPAPRFDEHTAEVLSEAGVADAEQERLRDAGVVGGTPDLPAPRA